MLPNFFVVGAQKAGTTSLHKYLSAHPDIYLPAQKETKFFARPDRYAQGIEEYERRYFSGCSGESAVGEVDPDYMFYEEALDRMGKHLDLGKVKFIFLLRNPVERAYSHYLMTCRRGEESLEFGEAILAEKDRAVGDFFSRSRYSYVSRGLYLDQIERFVQRAGRENVLVLLTENLQKDPVNTLERSFEFLGVDPDIDIAGLERKYHGATLPRSVGLVRLMKGENPVKNAFRILVPVHSVRSWLKKKMQAWNQSDRKIPALSTADRDYLNQLYKPHNDALAAFTGYGLEGWR